MKSCSAHGRLHCGALPLSECFGRPPDWCFQISKDKPNWKRTLLRHERLHQDHMVQADALLRQASLMSFDDGQWRCRKCQTRVAQLRLALAHKCKQQGKTKSVRKVFLKRSTKRQLSHPQPEDSQDPLAASIELDFPKRLCSDEYNRIGRSLAECLDNISASPFNAASPFNRYKVSSQTRSPALQVGHFFAWPGREGCYGAIWSHDGDVVNALPFWTWPRSRNCSKHAGGCWRPGRPIRTERLSTEQVIAAEIVYLVPRESASARSTARIDERCFGRCSFMEGTRPPQLDNGWMQSMIESAAAVMTDDVAAAALELWTPQMTEIYKTATARELTAPKPTLCPSGSPDGNPCCISHRGSRSAGKVVSSAGCFHLTSMNFSCKQHGHTWTLTAGPHTKGCSIVGDVLGKFLICGEYWPAALLLFEMTEMLDCARATVLLCSVRINQSDPHHGISRHVFRHVF